MIDLQLILRQNNKKFSINEAPQELELYGTKFRISALIECIRDEDCLLIEGVDDIGHYIPHIKRCNGLWENNDDLKNKAEDSNCNRRMEVHTLFYIKNITA